MKSPDTTTLWLEYGSRRYRCCASHVQAITHDAASGVDLDELLNEVGNQAPSVVLVALPHSLVRFRTRARLRFERSAPGLALPQAPVANLRAWLRGLRDTGTARPELL